MADYVTMHAGFAIAALFVAFPVQAFAWGTDGHRMCAVAWDEMKPAARQHVEDLLQVQGEEAFAETCLWADNYRSREGHEETAPWHYVNVPIGAKSVDILRDCAPWRSSS